MEAIAVKEDGVAMTAMPSPQAPSLDGSRYPLENPIADRRPNDPLCQPHPDEPGVKSDGTAAPLENPGRPPSS